MYMVSTNTQLYAEWANEGLVQLQFYQHLHKNIT